MSGLKKILGVAAGLVLVAGLGLVIWAYQVVFNQRVSQDQENIFVEIENGTSKSQIGQLLVEKGIIAHPRIFLVYTALTQAPLKAGLYYFSPHQTISQIVIDLSGGKISEKKITIIEGWRREQIAQYLASKEIVSYDAFIKQTENLEGRLFPDTYRIGIETTAEEIVNKMTKNFENRLGDAGLTYEQLIVASIVEREAKRDEDRAKIAGVFFNRLGAKMPLEADPTVQYAKDSLAIKNTGDQNFPFWREITANDIREIQSPYNTYLGAGLPAGPISNPGLKSIKAAQNPEKHDNFFFFHLTDGSTVYSQTREEHTAKIQEYLNQM